ncbi:AraC family transcriptional regulator [Niallia alba]|uniref:AraC family transcriptional regulator n=1 Tax=Niallia alba TaxID=2729105 RepID=UPI002E1BF187|nr:AraC family transcriptional regulator [Niallia alba]
MDKLQRTCAKFFAFSSISLYCYSNEMKKLFHFPEFYSELKHDFVKKCILEIDTFNAEQPKPIILTIDTRYHFAVIPLQQERTLLVGPVALYADNSSLLPIYEFFSNRHKCTSMSYENFLHAISFLTELCTGNTCEITELIRVDVPILQTEPKESLPPSHLKISYTGEALEQRLLKLIEKGEVDELKKQLEFPSYVTVERMSSNPIQHQKYLFIIFMTMAVRAAIKGGLDDEKAFELVGKYCIKMDNCSQINDITSLIYQMAINLCREVNKHNINASLSSTMRNCCAYIRANLYAPLTLSILAKVLKISTRTLSERFQKELEMTPMAYVRSARIEEAKFLLKYTNHSVLDISIALQFSSQSHFTNVFHRVTGLTPRHYQETDFT